jgi:hypothetical protein
LPQQAFFLFSRVKWELAGLLLSQDSFKISCEGVIPTTPKMSLPLPFDSGQNAAKSASALAMTKLKNNLK